jgi:signal transduction histidine kinase
MHGAGRKSEIKVSTHGSDAIVSVVRDVTERYRWFEAERRAHAEVLRRQRDAQSQTRFVRHEVKNGLLAGIELCDSLRNEIDAAEQNYRHMLQDEPRRQKQEQQQDGLFGALQTLESDTLDDSNRESVLSSPHISISRKRVADLDLLLHEVLETVLAEAMARDVIHEVYKPRVERLDVEAVLTSSVSTKSGKSDRFPIRVKGHLPFLQVDSQLLRYIHRNAISNATKYGKSGGRVDTILSFDEKNSILRMDVINDPGLNHDKILKLSWEKYNQVVFSQGETLHDEMKEVISSGDGAWIMQKCAKTMGGSCTITFEPDQTIFTFTTPAEPLVVSEISDTKDFVLPPETIGIAVDDSKIQRKMMGRILSYTGISPDKTHILGESPSQIMGLKDLIFEVLDKYPESNLVVLIDENLDYGINSADGENVALSGSMIMQGILKEMTTEQEGRVLALVRSANDSTTDVAQYIERTHGFFPKAPMQKERVREIIAPLWAEKFMSSEDR